MELLSALAPVPVGLGATAVPPPLLGAEAQLLGREATLTEDGENQVTQGRQRVVHNAFACEQELDTTAVSRDAWLSMAYLTLLDSLAIAVIRTVVQPGTEMGYISWFALSVFYPWDMWQESNGIISGL